MLICGETPVCPDCAISAEDSADMFDFDDFYLDEIEDEDEEG